MLSEFKPRTIAADRFWSKVEKTDTCWLWIASTDHYGYGRFGYQRKGVRAHRWSYETEVGSVPEGLQLDHLCRVRACVRPSHLEPVTSRENTQRGMAAELVRARNLSKTRCKHGHSFDEANTWLARNGTKRLCKACDRERKAKIKQQEVQG